MDLSISLLFLSTSSKCLKLWINSIMCAGISCCSRNLAFLSGATCLYISMYALVELQWNNETFSGCYPNASLNLYYQAPVVQTLDSAIHRINLYPADSVIDFCNTYLLEYLNNWGQNLKGLRQPDCIISGPKMWILITLHKEKLDKLLLTAWLHNTILVIKSSISNNIIIIIIIIISFNYPSLKNIYTMDLHN